MEHGVEVKNLPCNGKRTEPHCWQFLYAGYIMAGCFPAKLVQAA